MPKNKRKILLLVLCIIPALILPMINISAYTIDDNLDIGTIYDDDTLEISYNSGLSFYTDEIKDESNMAHTLELNLSFDKMEKNESINDIIKQIIDSKSYEKLNNKDLIKTLEKEINTKWAEETGKESKVKIDYYAVDDTILYNMKNHSTFGNIKNLQKECCDEYPYAAIEFEYGNNNGCIVSTKYNLGTVGICDKSHIYAINIKALPEIENTNLSSELSTEEKLMIIKNRAEKSVLNLSNHTDEFQSISHIEKLALKALNEEFDLPEGNYFKLHIEKH